MSQVSRDAARRSLLQLLRHNGLHSGTFKSDPIFGEEPGAMVNYRGSRVDVRIAFENPACPCDDADLVAADLLEAHGFLDQAAFLRDASGAPPLKTYPIPLDANAAAVHDSI